MQTKWIKLDLGLFFLIYPCNIFPFTVVWFRVFRFWSFWGFGVFVVLGFFGFWWFWGFGVFWVWGFLGFRGGRYGLGLWDEGV